MGPRVLVTGATGFIGRALAAEIIAQGADARLLVRDQARAVAAGLPAWALRRGDLHDGAALRAAACGVELVFHLAGAIMALSQRHLWAVNAVGTEALVNAVRAVAPGARFVHVSSLAAAGPSVDGSASARPAAACRPVSQYGESKRQGELRVEAAGSALRWVIVRPPLVYGPGDASTRLLLRQASAPWQLVPCSPRPLSLIHVSDLVKALTMVAASSAVGAVLPVEGKDRLDTDRLAHALAAAVGRRVRLLRVPLTPLWPVALACEGAAQLRRRASILSRDKLRELRACGWVADPAPIRLACGFTPQIAAVAGLRATAEAMGMAR